jgi:site-specific recombinase XerC
LLDLTGIELGHVAAYVEQLQQRLYAPSVKQRLAAQRVLFDWPAVGQVILVNPASWVRGPRHSVGKGKTPVLAADEARAMLDAIALTTPIDLRDRVLIALMVLHLRQRGRGAADAGEGRLRSGSAHLGATAREGRQGA